VGEVEAPGRVELLTNGLGTGPLKSRVRVLKRLGTGRRGCAWASMGSLKGIEKGTGDQKGDQL